MKPRSPRAAFALSCSLFGLACCLEAEALAQTIELPAILSDGMVLPRSRTVPLWGRLQVGEDGRDADGALVEAELFDSAGSSRATGRAPAYPDGHFELSLEMPAAGGPFELEFRWLDGERQALARLRLTEVWSGEVWLASGQSNMEWPLWEVEDPLAPDRVPAPEPNLHLFQVPNRVALDSGSLGAGAWHAADPAAMHDFSAVAFFFGRVLQDELEVPIGLVDATWGGTRIEAWLNEGSLGRQPGLRHELDALTGLAERLAASEQENQARLEGWLAALDAADPGIQGRWWSPELTPANLGTAGFVEREEPQRWGVDELADQDGSRWLRRWFELPADAPLSGARLELGAIDDLDRSFLNGQQVGAHERAGVWDTPRVYTIEPGVLVAGANLLALRLVDTGGEGGFTGSADQLKLVLGDGREVPLAGVFLEAPGVPMHALEPFPLSGELDSNTQCALYHGMLEPLAPFPFSGGIWYQGESNRLGYGRYAALQRALIEQWRTDFRDPALPFFAVQIAPFGYEGDLGEAPRLREAQAQGLAGPRTGLAATIDIGDPENIHPTDKRTVGERLAGLALKRVFGRERWNDGRPLVDEGPLPSAFLFEGGKARVRFAGSLQSLAPSDGGALSGFELAGADRRFYPASASFDGADLLLSSPEVPMPVAVRYAFSAVGLGNLIGAAGLPAAPFRSDDWPIAPAELDLDALGAGDWQALTRNRWQVVNGNSQSGELTWRSTGGGLKSTGRPTGLLVSKQSYRDFVLELEWRHLEPGGNSGLFLWSDPLPAVGSPFARAIEVQIMDGDFEDWFTTQGDVFPTQDAKLVPQNGRGGMRAFPTEERQQPAPQWNHYRVIARDGAVELWMNGRPVTHATGAEPREGFLALEAEGSPIEFRRLRIAELLPSESEFEFVPVSCPYTRVTSLYSGLDLSGWKRPEADGPSDGASPEAFVANDWRLEARGDGRLELQAPVVDWPERAALRPGGGEDRAAPAPSTRQRRQARQRAREAPFTPAYELLVDFRILGRSVADGSPAEGALTPSSAELPLSIPGVAFAPGSLSTALASGEGWNRLRLRVERREQEGGLCVVSSAWLNEQALAIELDGDLFLSAEGRLSLPGLILEPRGLRVDYANLLFGALGEDDDGD